jgi:hypothetical protein
MAWQVTIDATTIGMIGSALAIAATAVWYASRAASKIDSFPTIERLVSRLRSDLREVRAELRAARAERAELLTMKGTVDGLVSRMLVVWHRLGFSSETIEAVKKEVAGDQPRQVVALQLVPLDPPARTSMSRPKLPQVPSLPREEPEDDDGPESADPGRRERPRRR